MGTFWQWLNGKDSYEQGFDAGKQLKDIEPNLTNDEYCWALDEAQEIYQGGEEFKQGVQDGYNHTSFWDWLNRK